MASCIWRLNKHAVVAGKMDRGEKDTAWGMGCAFATLPIQSACLHCIVASPDSKTLRHVFAVLCSFKWPWEKEKESKK